MRKRMIGESGVEVSVLGLGTWGLTGESYGPVEVGVARETIDASFDAGAQLIDLAPGYGPDFLIERLIGQSLAVRKREAAFLCLRVGLERTPKGAIKNFGATFLASSLESSLKRMNTDHVDALLLHDPTPETVEGHNDIPPVALGQLNKLREQGMARCVGLSTSNPEVLQSALGWGIDVVMVPYNLLLPSLLHDQLGPLRKAGVGVLVRSPLAYGVLAGTWDEQRVFAEGDHRRLRWDADELGRRVRQRESAKAAAFKRKCSEREIALRWVLSNEQVSGVVVGARTPQQTRENAVIGNDDGPWLTAEEQKIIAQHMVEHGIEL